MQKAFLTAACMCVVIFLSAQEILLPPGLYQIPQSGNQSPKYRDRATELVMPFYEDFSSTFIYPDQNVFSDSTAFVNNGFAIAPPTLGVATLDGLDAYGYLYEHGSSFAFPADTLTSRSMRMDSVFTGTPHAATAADSIYFSFFYQPQGLGEKPDGEDSLLLEFYAANQDQWIQMWSAGGSSYNDFLAANGHSWKCVMVPLTDTAFLNNGFKFRFRNYASYADLSFPTWASNADFWNIDYIYINADRDSTDTIPSDLAFADRKETLLKNYYSMPWNQFLAAAAAETAPEISVAYNNLSPDLLNVTERLLIYDLSGTTSTYNSGLSASNLAPYADTVFYRNPVPYTYTSMTTDKAEFEVKMCINSATISDPIASNDTMAFYQRFYNYFAPDDGSCEAGYGLTINGGKAAMKFKLNVPDTLRSVQMFFNRTLDNANQIYFYLTIWNDNGGIPGSVIYEQGGVKPEFAGGINNYYTYPLSTPIKVSGTFYVGWEQTTDEVLNLGFDRNTDRSSSFFYNTDGTWYNSLYAGTPMIRIVVGDTVQQHVGIDETADESLIYPNPCSQCGVVNFTDSDLKEVTVFDATGKIILHDWFSDNMPVHEIKPGLYTMMIQKPGNDPIFQKWILTQ